MEHKTVVIRRRLFGTICFIGGCVFFICLFWNIEAEGFEIWLMRIIVTFLFGVGGFLYVVLLAWKPLVVISSKGITVPYRRREIFIPWENVGRFEMLEQTVSTSRGQATVRYIGIFAIDNEGIPGAGEISQAITKQVTGWEEAPTVLINPAFTFVKIDKIMETLNEFFHEYKNAKNKR